MFLKFVCIPDGICLFHPRKTSKNKCLCALIYVHHFLCIKNPIYESNKLEVLIASIQGCHVPWRTASFFALLIFHSSNNEVINLLDIFEGSFLCCILIKKSFVSFHSRAGRQSFTGAYYTKNSWKA
jgi:hypothetical protein